MIRAAPVPAGNATYQVTVTPSLASSRPRYPLPDARDLDLPDAELSSHAGGSGLPDAGASLPTGAPSAVLAAAVQLAVQSASPDDASAILSANAPPIPDPMEILQAAAESMRAFEASGLTSPSASPLVGPACALGASGRPRWATSVSDEDLGRHLTASALGTPAAHAQASPVLRGVVPATPSPSLAPAPPSGWNVPAVWMPPGCSSVTVAGSPHLGSRRRWASLSDDEASPLLWPMRSPMHRPRRSHSHTPLLGPAASAGSGVSQATAAAATAAAAAASAAAPPFMLPQAHAAMGMQGLDPSCWGPCGAGCIPHAPGAWGMDRQSAWGPCLASPMPWDAAAMAVGMSSHMAHASYGWGADMLQHGLHGAGPMDMAEMAGMASALGGLTISAGGGGDHGGRGQAAEWSAVWIGERAFRAPASMKEQIENIGYSVKIYRSHDKCCRALDKKLLMPQTHIFIVSEADAEPLLQYLQTRGLGGVQIVVDAEGSASPEAAQFLMHSQSIPEESSLVVASSWDEVLMALRGVAMQTMLVSSQVASYGLPMGSEAPQEEQTTAVGRAAVGGAGADGAVAMDSPWTLVWISDQAFKPAAGAHKSRLESLGCQVKGYKTHKNAARALDKKRSLVRTMVLVSGPEAAPLLAYLASRPEIASTRVVVECTSRALPVRESSTCIVTDSFEAAVAAVSKVASDPGFV